MGLVSHADPCEKRRQHSNTYFEPFLASGASIPDRRRKKISCPANWSNVTPGMINFSFIDEALKEKYSLF